VHKILAAPQSVGRYLRSHWKLVIFIFVIIGAIFFFKAKNAKGKKQEFHTTKPVITDLVKTLDVSGVVDAKQKATLRFIAGGKVTYIGAQEGDQVKKGQVIARIDAQDLQKKLQEDLNLYFNQRMDFDQGKDNRKDVAPTNALDRTSQKDQKTLENSVLNVELGNISIKNTLMTSPIAGILVDSPLTVSGVTLLPTDTFEVVNPSSLIFSTTVDQSDIAQVKASQSATIILDAYPDQEFKTSVSYVSYKSAQSSTGTVYIVQMPIPVENILNPLQEFRLGMNGDAKIVVDQKKHVLAIPLEATKERDGKTYVSVKTGPDKSEEKEITSGLETNDQVEVKSGLTENDEVIIP
jgi:RND family efflux transporter MFP subunit